MPQSAPSLVLLTVFADCSFGCKQYNPSGFNVDHLVMSMCRVFSCVVGRGCFLWPVHSLCKILLAFALLHFVLQGQVKFACYSMYLLISYFCIPVPYNEKGHLFWVLVLECLHRSIQLQLLQHSWLGIYETMSHALWGHPRWTGHDGEFWQNMVPWRRKWQTTSVFLPWEPHEEYEQAKW